MNTSLRTDLTIRDICEGFVYNELEAKGLFGLNGKLTIQPEYQRNYIYADGKKDVKVIEENIMMRGGRLESPMNVEEFARYANKCLNVNYSLLINGGKKTIESVAIIGGGGSGNWPIAKDAGYDIYISGDAPHHVRREIVNAKYNYLDMPHEIEKIFIPTMKKLIHELDESIEVVMIDHEKEPKPILK